VLPRNGPVLIGPSRPPSFCELKCARKVLADEEVPRNRSLHVMGQGVRCFIYIIAPERSLVSILDVLIGLNMCDCWLASEGSLLPDDRLSSGIRPARLKHVRTTRDLTMQGAPPILRASTRLSAEEPDDQIPCN
jgi:hypothetical protein